MKKNFFLFSIALFLFFSPLFWRGVGGEVFANHQNCSSARVVCNITDNPSEGQICNSGCSGNNNLVNGTNSCFSGGLTRWGFYMFTIKQSGTLTLTITPSGGFFGTDDYNFAIFDVSNGCGNLGNALRCSAANTNGSATGLNMSATDVSEGSGGDGWCQFMNVTCGHTYVICLDVPSNGSSGFDMSFGGSCLFGAPQTPFTATPSTVCASQPVTFALDTTTCYVNNPFISYQWDFGPNATPQTYTGLTPPAVTFSANGPQNIILTTEFATGGGTCSSTTSQVVTVSSSPPVSTFTVSAPACTGNPVTITYTGNSATTATYTWNFGGATIISGTGQGPYTVSWSSPGSVTVSLDVSDCSASSSTSNTVTVTTSPTSTFTAASPVCIGINSAIAYTGTGAVGDTYAWNFAGGNIVSGSGQGPYSVNWFSAGTQNITLQVTDANGCSSPVTTNNVIVNPTPVASAGTDTAYCSGSTVTIGASSTSGYTYSWLPTAGLSNATVSNPTVIISNSGTSNVVTNYVVTVTSGGCSATDTVKVTVYPLPTSNFSATGPVCVEDGLGISYSGNADTATATFIWNFDSATVISSAGQTYVVSWDTSGAKTITLTVVQNGCLSSQQQVVITVNPPNANAGPDKTFCSGSSATIGIPPNSGYTYSWSPSAGLSSSTAANPTIALTNTTTNPVTTNYIVTTSFAGCTVEDTVAVTVNPEPVSNAGPDVNFCSGNSALIGTANNSSYTYSWSPATGLSNAAVSSPTVTLTNASAVPSVNNFVVTTTFAASGCTTSDSVNVTVFQIPTSAFILPDSICLNEVATITYTGNATSNANYIWNFGGGNASPGIGQGPHNVFWTTAGMAIVSLSVSENTCNSTVTTDTIIVKPFPVSDAGVDANYCSGDTVTIGISSTAGYSYLWTPATGLSSTTVSNPTVNNKDTMQSPLVTDYIVTTTLNGCSASDTVLVTVYQVPTSSFTVVPPQVCGTGSVNITYTGNATSNANYNWNFSGGTIISGSGQGPYTVNWLSTGTKYITLTVSENGCSSSATTDSVIVYPIPISNAGNDDSLCSGSSTTIGVSSIPGYSYSWLPTSGLSSATVSNPSVTLTQIADSILTSDYIVTTSANNCSSTDTVKITVYPIPVAGFNVPNGQCFTGNNFSFTNAGTSLPSATFQWDFGANANPATSVLQNPSGIVFSTPGMHAVSLTIAQYGCMGSAFIDSVMVYPMPSVSFLPNDSVGCEPFTVNFISNANSNNPTTYQWNFGDGTLASSVPNPAHTYPLHGTYNVSLIVTSGDTCSTTVAGTVITVNPQPVAGFSYTPDRITNLNPVANFTDESFSSIQSWLWSFGDTSTSASQNPTHSFPDTGEYFVSLIVTNTYGCKDTVIDTVLVLPDYNFFAPNAFTPNNDGKNDFFIPKAVGIDVSEFEMFIYDRWGNLIYVTQSPANPWDGTYDGKPVQQDVYVWVVNLRDVLKKTHNYIGKVTVVR